MGSAELMVAEAVRPVRGSPATAGASAMYSWLGLPVVGSPMGVGIWSVGMHLEPSAGPVPAGRTPLPLSWGDGADGGGSPHARAAPVPVVSPPPAPLQIG